MKQKKTTRKRSCWKTTTKYIFHYRSVRYINDIKKLILISALLLDDEDE